jgi:hypothetical protein
MKLKQLHLIWAIVLAASPGASAAGFVEKGESTNVRSRWQRAGDDAYDVITEFEVKDRWVPGFSLHMQRERSSPT